MFSCSVHISSLRLCSAVRMIAYLKSLINMLSESNQIFFLKEGRWFMFINHSFI